MDDWEEFGKFQGFEKLQWPIKFTRDWDKKKKSTKSTSDKSVSVTSFWNAIPMIQSHARWVM